MTALLKPSKAQTVQEAAMKRALTVIVLLVLTAGSFLVIPEQVSAGSSTDAALALGAFAVLNQIARGETIFNGSPHVFRQTVVVEQPVVVQRSEEHTSELQSHSDLVCRLLLEKKNL